MRDTKLISARLAPIVEREELTEKEILDDWIDAMKEMAEAGFNISIPMYELLEYRAARKEK